MPILKDRAAPASVIDKARRVVTVRASWETQCNLREWAKSYGFDLGWSYSGWPQSSYDFDFHVTIVASANEVAIEDGVRSIDDLRLDPIGFEVLGDNTPTIVLDANKTLTAIREFFITTFGITPTYAEFKPHISLSYKWNGDPDIRTSAPALPDFPLCFDMLQVSRLDDAPPTLEIEKEVGDAARPRHKSMSSADRATISGTRKTTDGYLVTDARVARGGNIQDYLGSEIGEGSPNQVFKVWRPENEIFKRDSLTTFAHKPVTFGHPRVEVSPETWRQDAIGHIGSEVARDGEFVRVPLVVMDGDAIAAIEDGTREISMGYECELVMEAGTTPDGRAYDAYQKNIRINHCAIVPAGRAGPQCRIGDSAKRSNQEGKTMAKSVTIDGKTFEVADNVAAMLARGELQEALVASAKGMSDAQSALTAATARADIAEKRAADAEAKVADLEKGKLSNDQISALAAELVAVGDAAKAIAPNIDVKGKTADAIKREAVTSRLGDGVKDKDAAYVAVAFDMLTKAKNDADPLAGAIKSAADAGTIDAVAKANKDYDDYLTNSWKAKTA